MKSSAINRRTALGLGAAALLAAGLPGCKSSEPDTTASSTSGAGGPTPPSATNASRSAPGASAATSAAPAGLQLPTTAGKFPVAYDIPGSADGVLPPFLFTYPANPVKTVTGTPATAGKVTAACQISTPVPTPMRSNPVWQAINKALGTTFDISYTPSSGWVARQQTLFASGDLPDLVQLNRSVTQLPDLLKKLFVDLTDHVAGDKIKQYPNLALQPQNGWKQVVFNDGIYGIPQTRPLQGGSPPRLRADIVEPLGLNTKPANGQELIDFMKGVVDVKANRWASSTPVSCVSMFTEMLGGPNNWAESGGTFTSQYASPQMEQALSHVAALWKAGVFHPDSFATGIFPKAFDAGQTVLEYGTFDPGVRYLLNAPTNPDYRIGFMIEPKFEGGGTAVARLGAGFYGFTGISKQAEGRVEELLRVLDWCGAPLGSEEALLAKYGIAGRDYTLKDGILTATPTAASEILVLGYLSYPPYVYFPTNPAVVPVYQAMHEALVTQYATTVSDPSLGLYSPTSYTPTATTSTKTLNDVVNDVIQGRKSLDDWRSAVSTWKKAAGDKIAAEYAAAV